MDIIRTDSANVAVQVLLDVLAAQGVKDIVISPGSRNTPLIMAAAARPEFSKSVIADERQAAFFALGMAMESHEPVILVCTSGTALYNYAPAVAEAFYQHIPLIVISADRPARWIDQDDSQTLHQPEALANIVRKSFDIPVWNNATTPCASPLFDSEEEWYVNRIANEAYILATRQPAGPVHINIQLDAPLDASAPRLRNMSKRLVHTIEREQRLNPKIMDDLVDRICHSKVMIICGFMPLNGRMALEMKRMLDLPNVVLMVEALSSIRTAPEQYCIDPALCQLKTLSHDELSAYQPDIVISMGGALVSRMLKDFIRHSDPHEHWALGDSNPGMDCFQTLTTYIDIDPYRFFSALSHRCQHNINSIRDNTDISSYQNRWSELRNKANTRMEAVARLYPFSEFSAMDYMVNHIALGNNLFLSNGTPIRYAQLVMRQCPYAIYGCRGVSGIDGTNATAMGVAYKSQRKTILITGDLSFSYCTEILGSPYFDKNLRIVVINNSGGGIFRFVKSTRELSIREKYFCAPPNLPLKDLCKAYGIRYYRAENQKELEQNYRNLKISNDKGLLEVVCPPDISAELLRELLS